MTGLVCPTCRKPSKEWGMDSVSLVCTNSECARRYRRLHPEIPLVVKGDFEPVLAFDVAGDLEPFEALPDKQWIAQDDVSWEARLRRVGLRTVARVDGIEWVLHHHRRLRSSFTLHGRVAVREAWPD